ncbi:MAG TPA: metallophosphoesterase [Mycobacteriales bacterium]
MTSPSRRRNLLLVTLVAAAMLLGTGCTRAARPASPVRVAGETVARAATWRIAAAGDISPPRLGPQRDTAHLVTSLGVNRVLALGDLQYPSGGLADFRRYYGPTWGHFRRETEPAPGNHEYLTSGARGYLAYWGATARPHGHTYYSFDLGGWHLISLDSNIARGAGSAQIRWLHADLAATSSRCVLAYWHAPRFSSGRYHGNDPGEATFWSELYARRADLVLNGHEHNYERFAPQTPGASASSTGIREFVVGTGGNGSYPFAGAQPNSQRRFTGQYGVLVLTLGPTSYSWRYVEVGGRVLDSGGPVSCH